MHAVLRVFCTTSRSWQGRHKRGSGSSGKSGRLKAACRRWQCGCCCCCQTWTCSHCGTKSTIRDKTETEEEQQTDGEVGCGEAARFMRCMTRAVSPNTTLHTHMQRNNTITGQSYRHRQAHLHGERLMSLSDTKHSSTIAALQLSHDHSADTTPTWVDEHGETPTRRLICLLLFLTLQVHWIRNRDVWMQSHGYATGNQIAYASSTS